MATIPDGWNSDGEESTGVDAITAAFAAIPMPSGGDVPPGMDAQSAPAVATIVAEIEAAGGRKRGLDDAQVEGAAKPINPKIEDVTKEIEEMRQQLKKNREIE